MQTLQGKYIWIIGASSGIGAAFAREAAKQGAIIALSARRGEVLEEIKSSLQGSGHIAVPFDAGDYGAMGNALATIKAAFPRIDSALFMAVTYKPHDGERTALADIQKMWNVNVMGAFSLIDILTPLYQKQA